MKKNNQMELVEIIRHYSDHNECIRYLEAVRWNGVPQCPYCRSEKSSAKELRYTCLSCNRSYSVLVGTIFESSKLNLTKWFIGLSLILSAKKGISSRQLARHLSINKDTAWLMQKKIRIAMSENDGLLKGIVEADETFIGGGRSSKYREKRVKEGKSLGTGYQGKVPVLGMVERYGKVITKVLNKAWGEEIMPKMKQWIHPSSQVVTDGFGGYYQCAAVFTAHKVLNHSQEQHRIGDYHMNTIEGFWSMFKRSLSGQYHKVGAHYVQNYFDELAFKFNHRKMPDLGFNELISRMLITSLP